MESNREWIAWGDVDPMWGVAAWPGRQRDGTRPWTVEEFYALGQRDWSDFRKAWDRYGRASGRAVDIGCGAGRITRALAADFAEVIGIDVAPGMLDFARTHADLANVEYRQNDGRRLPVSDAGIDAAFSAHVFQHFAAKEDAVTYLREIARILAPGGTVMIHLPIYVWPVGGLRRQVHELLHRALSMAGAFAAPVKGAFGKTPRMRGTSYPQRWLYDQLRALGFEGVQFSTFPTSSNDDLHAFVFARRPERNHS